jgi:hypothetical protein
MDHILRNIIENIRLFYDKYDKSLFLNKSEIDNLTLNFDDNYLINSFIIITTIINELLLLYNSITIEEKKQNLSLNMHICLLLNKYLIYIYTTIKIFNDIKFFISTKDTKDTKSSTSQQPSKKQRTINNIYNNRFDEYIKKIIQQFNKDILNIKIDDKNEYSYLLDIDTFINDDINKISYNNSIDISTLNINNINNHDYIISYIKNYLFFINKEVYIKALINYVTIPQYNSICWFISIITGITYSDLSKKILYTNQFSRTNANYNEFNEFIFNIITHITHNHKIYKEPIENDCPLYIYLKEMPVYIVNYLILNYGKNNLHIFLKTIIDDIINDDEYLKRITGVDDLKKEDCENEYYEECEDDNKIKIFYDKLDSIKNNYFLSRYIKIFKGDILEVFEDNIISNNTVSEFNTNFYENLKTTLDNYDISSIDIKDDDYKLDIDSIYIISFLYELLNIKTLSCNFNKNKDNIKIKPIKGEIDSPDIILINVENPINIKQEIHHYINFQFNDNYNEINYNGNSYKLDYIINISNDKMTCKNCAHCISAIHYDNNEYFHDSKYSTNNITCGDKEVSIPCSLIKQNWSNNIYNDICYEILKCGYIENQLSKHQIKDKDLFQKVCFTLTTRNTYVYVKNNPEPMTTGGSKKINYIYNNKTYKRTLYISNNKYYIIINKKKIYINKKNLSSSKS